MNAKTSSKNVPSLFFKKAERGDNQETLGSVSNSSPHKTVRGVNSSVAVKEMKLAEKKKKMIFFGKDIHFARQMQIF